MKLVRIGLSSSLLLSLITSAAYGGGDAQQGKRLAQIRCAVCHSSGDGSQVGRWRYPGAGGNPLGKPGQVGLAPPWLPSSGRRLRFTFVRHLREVIPFESVDFVTAAETVLKSDAGAIRALAAIHSGNQDRWD
jgi:hypothetical protein